MLSYIKGERESGEEERQKNKMKKSSTQTHTVDR
jgi:hypothetical protein